MATKNANDTKPEGRVDRRSQMAGSGTAYRYSGIVPAGAVAAGIRWGVLTAVVDGVVYGWVCLYIVAVFDAGWVEAAVKLGCALALGWGIGATVGGAMTAKKGRSVSAAMAVAGVCALAGLYAAWAVYLHALGGLERGLESVPLTWGRALQPAGMAGEMAKAAKFGTWELFGGVMAAGVYWGSWMVEAVVIVGLAVWVARGRVVRRVFCEACGSWCAESRALSQVGFEGGAVLREDLATGRLERIDALHKQGSGDHAWCEVSVEACPTCRETRVVTVVTQDWRARPPGEKREVRQTVLRRVVVTEAQCAALKAAGERKPG